MAVIHTPPVSGPSSTTTAAARPESCVRLTCALRTPRLRARSGVAARLGPARLAELVAALVRQVVPGFDAIAQPSDALVKAVSRDI